MQIQWLSDAADFQESSNWAKKTKTTLNTYKITKLYIIYVPKNRNTTLF